MSNSHSNPEMWLSNNNEDRQSHHSGDESYMIDMLMHRELHRVCKELRYYSAYSGGEVWNETAFERLVLKKKTKKLIRALVSDKIETHRSTDIISGKGNGLIMLLHGGPGTGKTPTAESVAEIARKPFYPVTCGNIGTKVEAV
ncbi:hypothetical protein F5Y11DRAFT_343799 [Daldinia sp. FL1419]|nr:hypothetical protein F5Y11DRAFT_343799 [Daldinia sp. FL1419]